MSLLPTVQLFKKVVCYQKDIVLNHYTLNIRTYDIKKIDESKVYLNDTIQTNDIAIYTRQMQSKRNFI